jgi:hypothetical protein
MLETISEGSPECGMLERAHWLLFPHPPTITTEHLASAPSGASLILLTSGEGWS